MKLGLCVIGCGNFAKTFANSVRSLTSDINLYFASRDVNKAEQYCRMFGGTGSFGSYMQAATSNDVQAMYICTPHYLHLEHTLIAASNGKHILIEKPISNNIEDAEQIIRACSKYSVNLMVAENYRFMPCVRLCKKLVDQGAVGRIRILQIQQESNYVPSGWRTNYEMNGGGTFIDAGIHKIHLARYLLGDPNLLFGVKPNPEVGGAETEDGFLLTAKWSTGEIGLINHSWNPIERLTKHWISISGTKGKIYCEVDKPKIELEQESNYQEIALNTPLNGIHEMVSEFIGSIREKRSPEITGCEGLQDLKLIRHSYQSAEEMRAIYLINNRYTT